jgi:hypothetical protein
MSHDAPSSPCDPSGHRHSLQSDLCSPDFGKRRKLGVLRQIVSDLKPRCFARHEEVTFGAYTWVIIETAKRNSEFRGAIRAVYNRRTTDAAKSTTKSRRGFKVFDQLLPVHPVEIFDTDPRTAAKGSTVSLSAV